MSEISEKDVRHVAKLARLALTDGEVKLYAGQFRRILDSMEELRKLDTAGVEPTAHTLGYVNVLREDVPRPCDGAAFLALAPAREADFFKVKKVIE